MGINRCLPWDEVKFVAGGLLNLKLRQWYNVYMGEEVVVIDNLVLDSLHILACLSY